MTKAKKITLAIAIVVIIGLMVTAFVTEGANKEVDCPDCKDGFVKCPDCDSAGILTDEESGEVSICPTCNTSTDACDICKGSRMVADSEGTVRACYGCYTGLVTCETCSAETSVRGSLWALLPPLIAIGLALITKEVYSSLFVGILAGGILYSDFSFFGTVDGVINDGLISAVAGTAGIFIFLVELGIIVALINKAGGAAAFGNWAKTHIKTRVGAMLATFVLGILIFVDDYFNCLTVGSVMRPVTDSKRISRAKLSYIIDATAAPICMIAPISSWAAAVSTYVPPESEMTGIELFIRAIPYNFYSLLTIVFIIAITLMKFDYGPMKLHELNAIQNGDLYTSGEKNESAVGEAPATEKNMLIDLIIPVVILIVSCVFGLVYVGGIFDGEGLIDSFANTDATVGLPWGGLIALVAIIIYMVLRRILTVKDSMHCIPQGFIAMVPAILILTFATALKNMTSGLGAAYYVGDMMNAAAEGLALFLPAIIFLVACVLAFATGTSWGTFGILIPIVTAIFADDMTLMTIGMSACLAGAVCGDHCSPISDTTIMSSAGGQCNHLNHVSTQIPYAITVAAISFVMFIIAGLVQNIYICLPLGIALTVGTLFVIRMIENKKKA